MRRIKLNIRKAILIAVCSLGMLANSAFAKSTGNGFWTIEANDNKGRYTIVRFFDDKQNLIYEERIDGIVLTMTPKNKKVLDKTLSLFVNKKWVAAQVKADKLSDKLR